MYLTVPTKTGIMCISKNLIADTKPVFSEIKRDLANQISEDDIHLFVYNLLSENEHGDEEELMKTALVIFNSRMAAIDDPELFAENFNKEDVDLKIGYDRGSFYPDGIGNWHGDDEFVFLPHEELNNTNSSFDF